MKFTNEQYKLLKIAYDCLEKVAEDIPFRVDDIDSRKLWEAFMALSIILSE
jgi:hypothetical protein